MWLRTPKTAWALSVMTTLACCLTASAQQLGAPTAVDINERLDRLEKENRELQKKLEQLSTPVNSESGGVDARSVESIVNNYLQRQADAKKADEKKAADEGYKIGTDLKMSATWKNGFVVTTPNDDFSLHIGGWVQWDNVWWTQSKLLQKAPGSRPGSAQGIASGVAGGGIGDLEDGTFFRRERIMLDGKVWENYEYTFVFAFENDTFNTIGLDEFWVGATNIPVIGTMRFGHVKNCIGLEADMTGSSRTMTFLERSSYSESVELNQNFVTGVWIGNNYFDQRATWSGVAFRPDPNAATGDFFGDNQWGLQGRLTALPIYEADGRCLLHLGWSGGWRNGASDISQLAASQIRLRARPEMRDDDPAGAFSPGVGANGNSNRFIDTSAMVAHREWLTGLEMLYIRGPFSLQAEYGFNWVNDVEGFAPKAGSFSALKVPQDYMFQGGYVQLAYTLTGENRSYDKRLGRLDSYYFGRKGLFNNAWFVRDEDGRLNWSMGAWEVAARYSYVDLNDGTGKNQIVGGKMDGVTLGLNWYLNDNLKFQFDWAYDHRYAVPTSTIPGYTSGLGIRMQFMY